MSSFVNQDADMQITAGGDSRQQTRATISSWCFFIERVFRCIIRIASKKNLVLFKLSCWIFRGSGLKGGGRDWTGPVVDTHYWSAVKRAGTISLMISDISCRLSEDSSAAVEGKLRLYFSGCLSKRGIAGFFR